MGIPDFMLQENYRSYEATRIKKKIEIDLSKVKQEEMTREKKTISRRNKKHGGRCYFFRGGGCNIPLIFPGKLGNL